MPEAYNARVDRPTVVIELADNPQFARDIAAGGVFVRGCTLKINSECVLLVRGPKEELEVPARVVYVDPKTGAGLEVVGFTAGMRDHLTRLKSAWSEPSEPIDLGFDIGPSSSVVIPVEDFSRRARSEPVGGAVDPAAGNAAAKADAADADADADARADTTADGDSVQDTGLDGDAADDLDDADPVRRKHALNLHERLRGLTQAQQIKHAASGDPQERMMLERLYNKNVWEPLLRNPRLTPPEVARIARMGTLPRVLL